MIKAFSEKTESQGRHNISMKPFLDFEDTNNLKNSYKAFKYSLDEFHDTNTVDTAGYFGTNHRLKEIHNKKFETLNDLDKILETIA